MDDTTASDPSGLAAAWLATMQGVPDASGVVRSHTGTVHPVGRARVDRSRRELQEQEWLAPGATRSCAGGDRAAHEEPDELRTCFERDRDRIVHSRAFRRLAGKTQVFVFPADHQRTRLTHALEVAQVAVAIARALALNVPLVDAIALGHDCGHGPGGHASEAVFARFLDGGFHHASWGADVVLAPLNLCSETLDGIRSHSWSRPAPSTPEGAVVSWADRIAYCAHDLEDAIHAGIVKTKDLPAGLRRVIGETRALQLDYFVRALCEGTADAGHVAMPTEAADALAGLREFNYERIYHRPESVAQGRSVAAVLDALVEHHIAHPHDGSGADPVEGDPVIAAVRYVNGMTDRYSFASAVRLLGWERDRLPVGIDVDAL